MPALGMQNVNASPERAYSASLSLSGCGFLCIYHIGVCAAVKEYVPQLLRNRISGASAGSIIAAGVVCNVCFSQAVSFFLSVVSEARSYMFGALDRDFDLMKLVRTKLNAILPNDAHQLCAGRLRISVTRLRDMENVVLDEFRTKDELIDAICCSCFIPVYGGFVYPTFRGEIYVDGGASDNQPAVGIDTITVSPFSGESDICPTDEESASLFDWNLAGTSIRLTANNLYRAALCLFPPSAEECISLCRSGFTDALKFLQNNGFTSNVACYLEETDLPLRLSETNEPVNSSGFTIYQESVENEKIAECTDVFPIRPIRLPHLIRNAFDETKKYISTFRILQLAHYMTFPLSAAYQWFRFCQCLSTWLTTRITRQIADDWQTIRIKNILDLILNEIRLQEREVSARLSQQLAITEVEFRGNDQQLVYGDQLNLILSSDAIKEREALGSIDRLLSKATALSAIEDSIPTLFPEAEKLASFSTSLHVKE